MVECFWKIQALVVSALTSIAVFAAIMILCGCCIPCMQALLVKLINRMLGDLFAMLTYESLRNQEEEQKKEPQCDSSSEISEEEEDNV